MAYLLFVFLMLVNLLSFSKEKKSIIIQETFPISNTKSEKSKIVRTTPIRKFYLNHVNVGFVDWQCRSLFCTFPAFPGTRVSIERQNVVLLSAFRYFWLQEKYEMKKVCYRIMCKKHVWLNFLWITWSQRFRRIILKGRSLKNNCQPKTNVNILWTREFLKIFRKTRNS